MVADLSEGFQVGIPPILVICALPNHPSLVLHVAGFQSVLDKEFAAGRYLGPFSQAELEATIGPFQTLPLSIIPKANQPFLFHIIQNFSYPHSASAAYSSINSHINSADFPYT